MDPSPRITWRLAGRTAISLVSMKGVPASTSTSRFSTTRPSKVNVRSSRVNDKRVSPTTCRGDEPSAWWTDWKLGDTRQPKRWTTVRRVMFPVAPLSMVMRTGWCAWNISRYGDWRVCMRKTWVLGLRPGSSVSLSGASA